MLCGPCGVRGRARMGPMANLESDQAGQTESEFYVNGRRKLHTCRRLSPRPEAACVILVAHVQLSSCRRVVLAKQHSTDQVRDFSLQSAIWGMRGCPADDSTEFTAVCGGLRLRISHQGSHTTLYSASDTRCAVDSSRNVVLSLLILLVSGCNRLINAAGACVDDRDDHNMEYETDHDLFIL